MVLPYINQQNSSKTNPTSSVPRKIRTKQWTINTGQLTFSYIIIPLWRSRKHSAFCWAWAKSLRKAFSSNSDSRRRACKCHRRISTAWIWSQVGVAGVSTELHSKRTPAGLLFWWLNARWRARWEAPKNLLGDLKPQAHRWEVLFCVYISIRSGCTYLLHVYTCKCLLAEHLTSGLEFSSSRSDIISLNLTERLKSLWLDDFNESPNWMNSVRYWFVWINKEAKPEANYYTCITWT